jgi:hypothetical protein
MAFVFAGIIGGIVGGLMAGSLGLLFAGIFGGIGFGALSLVFDSNASSSTQIFAAAFGGAFALVGVIAGVSVLVGAVKSLASGMGGGDTKQVRYGKTKTSSRGSGSAPVTPAFSTPSSASFNSSGSGSSSMGVPSAAPAPAPTPLNLIPGLQAARKSASGDAVDELSKLAALHERGGLTDEEFANAKAKLLQQL